MTNESPRPRRAGDAGQRLSAALRAQAAAIPAGPSPRPEPVPELSPDRGRHPPRGGSVLPAWAILALAALLGALAGALAGVISVW